MDRRKFLASAGAVAASVAAGGARAAIGANDKIGLAAIGVRNMGWNDLSSAMATKGARLVAIADVDKNILEKRGAEAAKKFGAEGARVYTDYRELLADPEVETVHVCTPNRSHSFITVDALDAGKHVICEKPMAINSVEAKKMLDAAKRNNRVLTIGYQSRQRDDSLYMKKEAEEGTFGDIYYANAIAIRRRAVPTWGVFLDEYEQGGGPLIDIGTHALDLTLWIMDNYKPKYLSLIHI